MLYRLPAGVPSHYLKRSLTGSLSGIGRSPVRNLLRSTLILFFLTWAGPILLQVPPRFDPAFSGEAAARGRGELVAAVVAVAAGPAHVSRAAARARRRKRLRPSSGSPRRRRTPPSPRLPCVTTCLPVFVAWRLCPVCAASRAPEFILIIHHA